MAEKKNKGEGWKTDVDSKYRLVLVAARRSKQLQKGARPRVQTSAKKPTRIALEEVERRLVRYETVSKETVEGE